MIGSGTIHNKYNTQMIQYRFLQINYICLLPYGTVAIIIFLSYNAYFVDVQNPETSAEHRMKGFLFTEQ